MRHQLSGVTGGGLALLAGLMLLAAAPTTLHAQVEAFRGTYVLDAAASDDVDAAIGRAMRGRPAVAQHREQLRKANEPYARLRIGVDDGIAIDFAQGSSATFRADRTPLQWRSESGEEFEVTTRTVRGRLEQRFVSPDGRRTNTYTLGNDGRSLVVHVVVESPRLSSPLRYKLVYDRAN